MEFKDYLRLPIRVKIAEFADKAEQAIKGNYTHAFGIGVQEISVYTETDSENTSKATLTIEGLWKWHDEWWGGRYFEVNCTGEDIFRHFVELTENNNLDNTTECALYDFKRWVFSLPTFNETDKEEFQRYLVSANKKC